MRIKTVLRAAIDITGPWLIGDSMRDGDRHTTPLRDIDGVPEVPTASLAGSLRHHFARHQPQRVTGLFGTEPQGNDDGGLTPSRLRMLGTTVQFTSKASTSVRTTTSVDPESGSARRHTLRTDEYVDSDARVHVYMSVDGVLDPVDLQTIKSWVPTVGRRRTNGWGKAQLVELRTGVVDLARRGHLLQWLSGGGPNLIDSFLTASASPTAVETATELLNVRFSTEAGLHIGSGDSAGTHDVQRSVDHEEGASTACRPADIVTSAGVPIVPSSTWRGIIRAQCAFILRSIGCDDTTTDAAISAVFGDHRHRGTLTFHDSTIESTLTNTAARKPGAFATADDRVSTADHVSIDRITGGARAGLLFCERIARGHVTLRVTVERPDELPAWLPGLLRHVVHDIHDGFLGVGGRTTRGLGTLRLTDPSSVPPGGGIAPADVAATLSTQELTPA